MRVRESHWQRSGVRTRGRLNHKPARSRVQDAFVTVSDKGSVISPLLETLDFGESDEEFFRRLPDARGRRHQAINLSFGNDDNASEWCREFRSSSAYRVNARKA